MEAILESTLVFLVSRLGILMDTESIPSCCLTGDGNILLSTLQRGPGCLSAKDSHRRAATSEP